MVLFVYCSYCLLCLFVCYLYLFVAFVFLPIVFVCFLLVCLFVCCSDALLAILSNTMAWAEWIIKRLVLEWWRNELLLKPSKCMIMEFVVNPWNPWQSFLDSKWGHDCSSDSGAGHWQLNVVQFSVCFCSREVETSCIGAVKSRIILQKLKLTLTLNQLSSSSDDCDDCVRENVWGVCFVFACFPIFWRMFVRFED